MSITEGTPERGWLLSAPMRKRVLWFAAAVILVAGLALALRPLVSKLWPRRTYYDFVASRGVTERLVDPALFKSERWEVSGETRDVLFVHPGAEGSTALVYPVMLEPNSTFQADLAVAPEAWTMEGDGVTFSLYVENEAGMHLLHSRYVDPKHHQEDRRWLPMRVDLAPFGEKLVRIILVVGSGPAGDRRCDWAGWGAPRLVRPSWP